MEAKLGNEGERDWVLLSMHLKGDPNSVRVTFAQASSSGKWWLKADGDLRVGDLFMVCGTKPQEGKPDSPDYCYRIYEVADKGLCLATADDTANVCMPWVAGGKESWQSGNWFFSAKTGKLWDRETEGYSLIHTCPLYLEAVAHNWTWKEHFAKVLEYFSLQDSELRFLATPAVCSTIVRILSRERQLELKCEELDHRVVELSEAVHGIGIRAWDRRHINPRNELFSLASVKGMTGSCAYHVADDFVEIFDACQEADPTYFDKSDPRWQFDKKKMFI